MNMSWDVIAYWICFISGMAYAALAAILGGLFGFEHGGFEGGIEGGGGGFEGHDFGTAQDISAGHGEATAGAGPGEVSISPLSPMTMATFSTVFGGTGLILTKMFGLNIYVTLPASVGVGLLVAAGVFGIFYRVFQAVQASSEVELGTLVGKHAEVVEAISERGVGQVAYVSGGGRFTATCRSEDGVAIDRFSPVEIVRVVGNTLYVRPLAGKKEE
jgi:membrane protein implicated in regulation of membrane protease activity